MRLLFKKAAAVGFLVLMGLWLVGSIRGLTLDYPPPPALSLGSLSDEFASTRNYSNNWNNIKQLGLAQTPVPMVIDQEQIDRIQIHEKIANMTAGSAAFDLDEARIRGALASHNASIITEKNSGIAPQRRLALEVGVHPEKFDALVAELRQVGVLASIRIEQKDRTSEFRKLHAQRQALKKYLESVQKLRNSDKLALDDALRLDQKLKDIENELRPLSDQLGDFLGKESFYHVQFSLAEHQPGDKLDRAYTLPQRIFHAFLWAVVWWTVVALAVFIVTGTAFSVWTLRQRDV